MNKPTIKPFPGFNHRFTQYELELLLTNLELTQRCGIDERQRKDWLYGRKPVPKLAYVALNSLKSTELPKQFGKWSGFYLERDHLCSPAMDMKMHYSEFEKLHDYRRSYNLCQQQAELIESLIIQRDYYRDQCHREAKFGLMLNRIFGVNL